MAGLDPRVAGPVRPRRLAASPARDFDVDRHLDELPPRLRAFAVSHPLFLILGRGVPFGFHLVNVLAGVPGLGAGIQLL